MPILKLRLLGALEARLDPGPVVDLPTRKARALLAFLALRPGQPVARERLASLLWSDRGEEQARASRRPSLFS